MPNSHRSTRRFEWYSVIVGGATNARIRQYCFIVYRSHGISAIAAAVNNALPAACTSVRNLARDENWADNSACADARSSSAARSRYAVKKRPMSYRGR